MNNLKIYKRTIPYLVAGAITFAGFSLSKNTPFIKDSYEESKDLITTLNKGVIIKEYENRSDINTGVVEHYSKWEKSENGYERTIDYYLPDDYTVKELKEIAKNSKDVKPSYTTKETRKNLTIEESNNNKESVFATYVEKDSKKEVILESDLKNDLTTCSAIAIFLLMCLELREIEKGNQRKLKL